MRSVSDSLSFPGTMTFTGGAHLTRCYRSQPVRMGLLRRPLCQFRGCVGIGETNTPMKSLIETCMHPVLTISEGFKGISIKE